MVQILNLGGAVRTSGNQAVALDTGGDASIEGANETIFFLTVELVEFSVTTANEFLEISAGGRIVLSSGMDEDSVIFIDGIEIGTIGTSTGDEFHINFNEEATPARVEVLLHALTYRNTSTAAVVAEERSIRIQIGDVDGQTSVVATALVAPLNAIVITSGSPSVIGTAGDDVFVVSSSSSLQDVNLTGGSGNDALHVVGGGELSLANFTRLSGIEALRGSAEADSFSIHTRHLLGLAEIDGGSGSDTTDELLLSGSYFDFRDKTLISINRIEMTGGSSPVFIFDVGNIETLFVPDDDNQGLICLIDLGTNGANAEFRLAGANLSQDQKDALVAAGFDANNIYDGAPPAMGGPVTTGLHGDTVGVAPGTTTLLAGEDFAITASEAIRKVRVAMADPAPGDLLGIQEGGDIDLDPAGIQQGGRIHVGVSEGILTVVQPGLIEVTFISGGSVAATEALIEAMTYTRPAGNTFAPRNIVVSVTDDFDRIASSTMTVYGITPVNHAPTAVKLNGQTGVSVAENSAFAAALSASDPDGDALTFVFDSAAPGGGNAGGMFVIDAATQQLRLAPGKSLDFETARNHTVYVKALDGQGGVSEAQPLTISVTDVDEGTTPPPPPPSDLVLVGTKRADRLMGGDGNDMLYGKAGKDVLSGGLGKDAFVFDTRPNKKTNLDKIADYSVADDTIWLENKVFTKLGKAAKAMKLNKKFFAFDKAKDGNDHIVYVKKTGALFYDQDGSGTAHAAVQIATLTKNLKGFSAAEFFVV
jgi:Ca2+-binding RTX toxin-like protein